MADLTPEQICVFGRNGKLQFAARPDVTLATDKMIRADKNVTQFPPLTHMVEVPYLFQPQVTPVPHDDSDLAHLLHWLSPIYKRHVAYGPFGDFLFVTKFLDYYLLTNIGVKAFHKPGVASDVVPIVIDSEGRAFFVGIIRGQNPGKGLPATIGGFHEIDAYNFASSPECLFAEGREEAGLYFESLGVRNSADDDVPFPKSVDVSVCLAGETFVSTLQQLGIIYTSEEEELSNLRLKRVSFTAGYVLPIYLNRSITEAELMRALIPEDKAENNTVFVREIVAGETIEFGIGHHQRLYQLALEALGL